MIEGLMTAAGMPQEQAYLSLLLTKTAVCRAYQPKFGQGSAVSLQAFQQLYGADAFYTWFGLDHPLTYASHKAAGGITSLYRQIGIGCEQLFRRIIQDQLSLDVEQSAWSYALPITNRKARVLSLDARIALMDIPELEARERVHFWLASASQFMHIDPAIGGVLKGAVFEVRQGYKSKDSKRQNADIANAGVAYQQGYLPVLAVLSDQIDNDVAARYTHAGWLLLRGQLSDSPYVSTFAFCKQVLGYDLAGFLARNTGALRQTVEAVLIALLTPDAAANLTPADAASVDEISLIEQVNELDEDGDADEA